MGGIQGGTNHALQQGEMGSRNVLIVEDDNSLSNLIAHTFERAGMTVTCADSSVDAILKIEQGNFNVIVLDVMLGGTSGLYVVDALRDIPEDVRPKVIIITAARGNILANLDRTIVKAVLFKPLDVPSLAAFADAVGRGPA